MPIGRLIQAVQENTDDMLQDGKFVTLAGMVMSLKVKLTKKQTQMAYVTLEDTTSSLELLVFEKALVAASPYLQPDQAVIVHGRISAREEEEPKLMVDEVWPLTDYYADQYLQIVLRVKLKNKSFIVVLIALACFGGYYFIYFLLGGGVVCRCLVYGIATDKQLCLICNGSDFAHVIKGMAALHRVHTPLTDILAYILHINKESVNSRSLCDCGNLRVVCYIH